MRMHYTVLIMIGKNANGILLNNHENVHKTHNIKLIEYENLKTKQFLQLN